MNRSFRFPRWRLPAPFGRGPTLMGVAALMTLLALTAFAAPRQVPGASVDELASMEVPGGMAAFSRVIGIDPDAPRARLMLTAIRVLWDLPDGQSTLSDRRRLDARGYLEAISAFERSRSVFRGQAVSLPAVEARGGRGDALVLADAFGAELMTLGGRWRLQPLTTPAANRRRDWLNAAGILAADILTRLNAGEAVALDRPVDTVPLLLPTALWNRVLDPPQAFGGSLFAGLLTDRRAALMYYGVAALDDETRTFVGSLPVPLLYDDARSPVFALSGRSLRIARRRVEVPGGDVAIPLWEAVVGAPVTDTIGFTGRLLERDEGKLALLYDGIAHLSPAVRTFVLGLDEPDAGLRVERFSNLVAAASASLVSWNPRVRPFERLIFDPTHLLMRTKMREDGRPSGPWHRRFWEAAFETAEWVRSQAQLQLALTGGRTSRPPWIPSASEMPGGLDTGERPDARWLVGLICVQNTDIRRDRAEAWLFAQRVFPSPTAAELPDVFVAVRGFQHYRTLALTLERLGITNPVTYAAAIRAADHISRADGDRVWTLLAQFQGALAIVERARFNRSIDVPAAERLVRSLAAVPVGSDREYLGGVAAWLERDILPVAGPPSPSPLNTDPDRPLETRVLAIMAGAVVSSPYGDPARMPTAEWEGLLYRVDPAGSTFRRLVDVRARQGGQGGASLDAALALSRALASTLSVSTVEELSPRIAELSQAVAGLPATVVVAGERRPVDEPDLAEAFPEIQRQLTTLKGRPDRDELTHVLRPLRRAADWYLGRVLASISYAPNLGEPDSPALLGNDPAPRHDFGLADPRPDSRVEGMWRMPIESHDRVVGWRVTGSLLGLDVALGQFALRRVPSEVMPEPPVLTDDERQAFTEPVVLVSPFDYTESGRNTIVAALRAGRARIASASSDALLDAAVEAGLDEWRLQILRWAKVHEPDRVMDIWSLGEVVRLGFEGRAPMLELDAWGGSGASTDGNLACAFPWQQPWTTLSGRKSARLVPALVPDLGLALAEALAGLKLPARASGGVLAVATQDLLDTVRTNHDDDWVTLVAHARKIAVGRLDDYVAALTIGGPLVPAEKEPQHGSVR